MPNLHEEFPRLELLLVEEKTEVVLQQLTEGHLDAGLLALPIDEPHLHCEPLFDEEFVMAVPGSHPLARTRKKLALAEYALMAAVAATAVLFRTAHPAVVVIVLASWAIAFAAVAVTIDRRWRVFGPR